MVSEPRGRTKIFVEKINVVYNVRTDRFEAPTGSQSRYRVVKQNRGGFVVVSTHSTSKAARAKVRSLKKR